jgi:hypothetical protein
MTERIGDLYPKHPGWVKDKLPCTHLDHLLPYYRVFEPGRYKHTCPQCGHVTEFDVYLE